MAYRFLLEVPEALAAEASVAVEQTPDAQVLLVRDSHGLGFDDPYVDLTVASHTLQVIQSLYTWFDTLGASRPDIRIVLHGGERESLEATDRGGMVAAIRRDQPWVERSLPKVGEHEAEDQSGGYSVGAGVAEREQRSIDATAANAPMATAVATYEEAPGRVDRRVTFKTLNHVGLQVLDLAKAERFYQDFLQMDLVGRLRRNGGGGLEQVNGAFDWDRAVATGTEADVSVLVNGAVTLALHRIGRGGRLGQGAMDYISVSVDATSYANLRGQALMRPLTILIDRETAFTFRDPFGLVWEVAVSGASPFGRR